MRCKKSSAMAIIIITRLMRILIIFAIFLKWQYADASLKGDLARRNEGVQSITLEASYGSNALGTTNESAKGNVSRARMQMASEEDDEHRYIVKFKDGSVLYTSRMEHARRKLKINSEHSLGLDHNFLPFDNVEIMTLATQEEFEEWENNTEVDFVEKGKYSWYRPL